MIGTSIGRSQADVIKMESFEMKSDAETYTDPMDPAIDHFLVNQPGQALVVYAGWSAWYRNTRNGVGLTDGDVFGVGKITKKGIPQKRTKMATYGSQLAPRSI